MMQRSLFNQLRHFSRCISTHPASHLKSTVICTAPFYHKVLPKICNQSIYLNRIIKYKFDNKDGKSYKILYALTVTGLLKFLGLTEEDESSELIQILKRGELTYRREEFGKSEQIFHVALRLAQELHNENAVTFIYDRMANIAFESKQYEKARTLFVEVLNRLFHKGIKEDDLVVVHISFKLAKIFENLKDYFGAESGYDYCFKKLEPKLKEQNEEYEDARTLYKTLLNGYAYFHYSMGKLEKAFEFFKKTYDLTREIYGERDEEVVLVLNNLGTICKHRGDLDGALSYFQQAEKIGNSLPDMKNFSFVYLNLAYCYMEANLLHEAHKYCQFAGSNAAKHDYQEGIKESDLCIIKVKEMKKNLSKG